MEQILGIDVGGSGIKGGLVDLEKGEITSERVRIDTPAGFSIDDISAAIKEIVQTFDYKGKVGVGFPAPVRLNDGVVLAPPTAHHYPGWKGKSASESFSATTGCEVTVVNDADAAGLAEAKYGAGMGVKGTIVVITLGTGVGSGLIHNGQLIPNSEFGKLYLKGHTEHAEQYMAGRIKDEQGLSHTEWGKRVNEYLVYLNWLITPEMIILGGGISRKFEKYKKVIDVDTLVVPATMRNKAGIIGAAAATQQK
ncbi:MAG: polyphosphate glucokinase [Cellvibrionaceae bacterium]|jgi:polyphosphate glucokinase